MITPASGKNFDPTKIPAAVKDAGFTPGEVEIGALGTLTSRKDLLLLQAPGPGREFVLAGGARAEELKKQSGLLGKRVRVRGKVHPSHADQPPGLTVQSFEILAK